ncbi:hypothetical protein MVEN_00219600 [Mycena venus]|uniref:Uncharacterized protein n=1 Tax=Mycena venus TaxID=2733690 RepID=A0A8H7DB31_9AGAR|nr:hypothetical protein MVEN_00219600 [Mycena venus]
MLCGDYFSERARLVPVMSGPRSLIHQDTNGACTQIRFALPSFARPKVPFLSTSYAASWPHVDPMLSFRRTFAVNPEALDPGHPYSFDNSGRSGCHVSFFEFRGTGPPSSNFGHAGDVYVDLTPGSYALYWRDRHGRGPGQWRRWMALLLDKVPLYKYLTAHPWANHPQTSDLYLWVDPTGVTWTSRAEICASRVMMIQKNIATITPGDKNPDVEALVGEILARMLEAEDRRTLPPIQDSRDRYSGSSPHAGFSRPAAEKRRRSDSSTSQYSPSEALRTRVQLPPLTHSPTAHYRSPAHSPLPPPKSPALSPAYTQSPALHHGRRTPRPTSPRPSSDSRHPITAERHRQTPPAYDYPAAGPSNPRRHESLPTSPPLNPHPGATEQEMRESFAWNEMQRAQYAEAHFKRELRLKNRELSKFKKKEKDVISMSFMYQKKEQELMAALASVEQRSQAELDEQREAVRAAQRQVEEAERQTQEAGKFRELRRVEEALADARKEIQQLKSCTRASGLRSPHEYGTSPTDADKMEAENTELKDEMNKLSFARSERPGRDRSGG